MVKKIKNNDFSEVEASKIAIVNFSVTGNESCQIMEQIINETADEYAGKVDFYRANIAINQESPKKYDVENILSFAFRYCHSKGVRSSINLSGIE